MKNLFIVVALCALFGSINGQEIKVAVFDPVGNVDENLKVIIREELSNAVVNNAKYTVLERQLIDKVLEENKFQESGDVDDSQIGELGKKMGANYVCYASLTPMGSNYYVSGKFVKVETAEVEKQVTGKTKSGVDDLIEVAGFIGSEMFASKKPENAPNTKDIPNIDYLGSTLYVLPNDIGDKATWYEAKNKCKELEAYGLGEWRMPTKEELNVIRLTSSDEITFYINDYWTSDVDINDKAQALWMAEGKPQYTAYRKDKYKRFRCVCSE